jgi:hypothetical protein
MVSVPTEKGEPQMIKIENTEVVGWQAAIRGARNPMNSWDKSDSQFQPCAFGNPAKIGPNDLKLLRNLANAGPDHGKYLRMIQVYCDITGPLYWYKELDTYRMGVEKNSCSTMHKIHAKEFTEEDFSHDHLSRDKNAGLGILRTVIEALNLNREIYLRGKDKSFWWNMIQLLPSSYNQRRTYMFSYAALRSIYHARKNHKLDEWHEFCRWVESLPYSELITGGTTDENS